MATKIANPQNNEFLFLQEDLFHGRVYILAESISSIAIATFVTLLALGSAPFFAAVVISSATWFIALGGNMITCWTSISDYLPSCLTSIDLSNQEGVNNDH